MAISSAVAPSAVARVVGIETKFVNLQQGGVTLLPQRVAVVGQGSTVSNGSYSTDKRTVTSATEVGTLYGFGSPLHLAVSQLLPVNGDGVGSIPVTVFPMDDDGSGVASTGTLSPLSDATVTAAYTVTVGGIVSNQFVITIGDSVSAITAAITGAINAVIEMPVTAADGTTVVNLTSKWAGESANGITLSIQAPVTGAETITIVAMAGGLVNPNVDSATAQFGNVWETMVVNCMNIADVATLDKFQTFGDGRWGALVRKPLVVFTGTFTTDVGDVISITDSRKDDKINVVEPAPSSPNLPLVIAARAIARAAVLANRNPAHDYGSQNLSGLIAGPDVDQWDYIQRDQAVKAGSSTTEVKDGVINMSDTITMFHPTGDPSPAYRYVVDIVKLQNIIFNLDLIFATPAWDGAPLIPDDQPTSNVDAKKPKTAVAAVSAMLDSLGLNAIISDPDTAKNNTFAEIDAQNPKRLNVSTTVQLSGNANIISVDLNFGFFFGASTIVA